MIDLAATIAAMRAAGMDDTTVLNALACVRLVRQDTSGSPLQNADSPPDTAADRRRAYDRDRKARARAAARAGAPMSTVEQPDRAEVPDKNADNPPDNRDTPSSSASPLVPPLSPAPLSPPIIPPPPPPPPGDDAPEATSKPRKGTRLPADFVPDEASEATARELKFSNRDWKQALQEFRDYWAGVPGAKGCKLDWQATFRNSIRRFAERRHHGKPTHQSAMAAAFDNLERKIGGHRDPDDGSGGLEQPNPSGLAY